MKVKAIICQPMNGKTIEEIEQDRIYIKKMLESVGIETVNNIFDFENKSPIYYLAKSLELMSDADLVVFLPGWDNSRGCMIEFRVAKEYGKPIFIANYMN